jgi:hypothetical protein
MRAWLVASLLREGRTPGTRPRLEDPGWLFLTVLRHTGEPANRALSYRRFSAVAMSIGEHACSKPGAPGR